MTDVAALQSRFEAKARAELAAADGVLPTPPSVAWSGSVFAHVALVKGRPGPDDTAEARALSGADGEAARKALVALGYDARAVFATVAFTGEESQDVVVERIALQIEAVDPRVVIALDEDAAGIVATVAGLTRLEPGTRHVWRGRVVLAVEDFAASLEDEERKRRVWAQLQQIRREDGE